MYIGSYHDHILSQQRTPRGRTAATDGGQAMKRKSQRGTWIKEGGEEEPVNFLDPNIVKRVVGQFAELW